MDRLNSKGMDRLKTSHCILFQWDFVTTNILSKWIAKIWLNSKLWEQSDFLNTFKIFSSTGIVGKVRTRRAARLCCTPLRPLYLKGSRRCNFQFSWLLCALVVKRSQYYIFSLNWSYCNNNKKRKCDSSIYLIRIL